MSFALSRLRADVSRRLRMSGADFQDSFILSVADTVDDVIVETIHEATAFDPEDPATEVDVPEKYYATVRDGVLFYMGQDKRFTVNGEPVTRDRYARSLARMKGSLMLDEDLPTTMNFEVE